MGRPLYILTQVAPYTDGPAGVHGTLDQARTGFAELGEMTGLDPVLVADVADLGPAALQEPAVLALFIIGEVPFSAEQRGAVEAGWRAGTLRVLGVHSSTDACHTWTGFGEIIGARFDGHPWTQDFDIDVVDPAHPATEHLGARWPWHDEVYLFRDLHPKARVLLELAEGEVDLGVPEGRRPECGFPLAWCLGDDGGGRTFYTALGHFPGAWEAPSFMRHLAGGLTWIEEGRGSG